MGGEPRPILERIRLACVRIAPARLLSQADKDALVDALIACAAIRDATKRRWVLAEWDVPILFRIAARAKLQVQVTHIVETCAAHPVRLRLLVQALRHVEGNTHAFRAVAAFVVRLTGLTGDDSEPPRTDGEVPRA